MAENLPIGSRIQAEPGTLAHACGDKTGTIEAYDGSTIMVRMDQSGRLVPFRRDQLKLG